MTKDTNKTPPEKLSKKSSKNPAKTAAVLRDQGVDENENKQGVVAFSIDDVKALIESRTNTKKTETLKKKKAAAAEKKVEVKEEPVEKRVLGAASLSDILGFNPAKKETSASMEESSVPPKWKKYYKLLVELREELSEEISLHTSETLQHRSDDHAGDRTLEDDAGTDAFDRDFALSLVSSEQEALNEIEEALFRIKKGTYGVCEVTGKPISKERLTAVPFTRFSVEGQVEFEKNMRRKVDRNTDGLFADSTDSHKIVSGDDDDE
jgi:RNA polymerase-binding transcription factor DksA